MTDHNLRSSLPKWVTLAVLATAAVIGGSLVRSTRVPFGKSLGDRSVEAKPAPKPVPVLAAVAQARDEPVILRGLGQVTAFNTVALRSRVEGNITQVNFREGQVVHAGDLLIQLDARPYQAALDQAKANLTRDEAALSNARVDLGRYSELLKRSFTPEQQVATQKTTVAQSEAATQSDQAAIQAAALNVEYAALRSPIDGVTGIRQVDIGNLIQGNGGQNLVTITQIQPIYVIFTLPEADIDRVRDAMGKGTLAIQAFAADDKRKLAEGKLNLIDNTVDQSTGTVKLKAEFANKDSALWPGQFVSVHAVLSVVRNGVTIPADAVLTGPKGAFTYAIEANGTVSLRPLSVLQTENNRALIGGGLKNGDRVVTAGQFRLKPDAAVKIVPDLPNAGQKLSDAPAGSEAE